MNAASINRYCEQFSLLESLLTGAGLPWLRRARRTALERFAESGFPTTRDEDWKYTNVTPIERRAFQLMPGSVHGISAEQVNRLAFNGDHLLVFIDGRHAPSLSRRGSLPQGARLSCLATALLDHADQIGTYFSFDGEAAGNGFSALNAAFWMDGAYLDLAADVTVEQPIHLLFIATQADLAMHPYNIIHAARSSHATVIEHFVGLDSILYLTNASTRIVAEEGAAIEHIKLQQESTRAFHIAGIHAQQEKDSHIISHSFALGALLSRSDIDIRFDAEGCAATLNGLYIARGRQHVDHHTRIDHAKPRCVSNEAYKGVLDGAARAVFNGKIIVRPDAQQSDAQQSNRNLLLSKNAEVDTRPQLEIHADDVKCSHGATVGQLDEHQLFYLRSRGIDMAAAKNFLIYAFAEEIIVRINIDPLRERLEQLVINQLPDGQLLDTLDTPTFGER